jgi:hypothetical protein
LKKWADEQSVIIATINGTMHAIDKDPAKISAIQKAVVPAIAASIRGHHCLRFAAQACGVSGAGMQLITDDPDNFAGLLLVTHNIGPYKFPKQICVAVVIGNQDPVQTYIPYMRDTVDYFTRNGNPLRVNKRDGDHSEISQAETVELLDWMLGHQRICHPKLTPDEIKDGFKLVQKKLTELETAAPQTQAAEYSALLAVERVAKAPEFKDLKSKWFAASTAAADAQSDPVAHHRALMAISASPYAAGVLTGKAKSEFDKKVKELRAQKEVKQDWDSKQMLDAARSAEQKAGAARGKLIEVGAAYAQIAAKFPDTESGEQAMKDAERIQAALNAK